MKHGLIRDVEVLKTIEFARYTDFSEFILPLYEGRQRSKRLLEAATVANDRLAMTHHARDVLFRKLLMNNSYGKFAQNPRRFQQYYITDPMERPVMGASENAASIDWGAIPAIETDCYWIWSRPSDDNRFNNVATAASITGAARSVLLDALASCRNPVYCDTDSIICEGLADDQHIDKYELGGWDVEANISCFIGNGKKLYAYRCPDREPPKDTVIRAKGMNGVTWDDMVQLAGGAVLKKKMKAPTIQKDGTQAYITRELRATMI